MLPEIISQAAQFVMLHVPKGDRFDTDPAGTAVNMTLFGNLCAAVQIGAGGTGTAKFQVEACSASDGTGATAIPFKYNKATSGDTFGALTDATASDGVTNVAGTDDQYLIHVRSRELPDGKPWVRIKITEVVDAAVDAAVLGILFNSYQQGATMPSALT